MPAYTTSTLLVFGASYFYGPMHLQMFLGPVLMFQLMRLHQMVIGFQPSHTLAMSLSTEHLVLLGSPGRLRFWNVMALEENSFQVAAGLIFLKYLEVNVSFLLLAHFCRPS
ncbi:hypothetical protein ILYODFUR_009197 [Ilyodon furcidens]|uniref:Uncharacterized protein n=1 Tax=Ilyodon furcidens TaxID=33524 RepID=A0ABV0U6K8_9TELE